MDLLHAEHSSVFNQGISFSPDLNSKSGFPELVHIDQDLLKGVNLNQSKAWLDVVKENRYHQESIRQNFFEPEVKDNMKLAVISEDLTNKVRERWHNSIVFYVFGKKPYYNLLKEYMDINWKLKGSYQLFSRENGFFIIKCETADECDRILADGPYYYNRQLVFMRKWQPGLKLTREALYSILI